MNCLKSFLCKVILSGNVLLLMNSSFLFLLKSNDLLRLLFLNHACMHALKPKLKAPVLLVLGRGPRGLWQCPVMSDWEQAAVDTLSNCKCQGPSISDRLSESLYSLITQSLSLVKVSSSLCAYWLCYSQ